MSYGSSFITAENMRVAVDDEIAALLRDADNNGDQVLEATDEAINTMAQAFMVDASPEWFYGVAAIHAEAILRLARAERVKQRLVKAIVSGNAGLLGEVKA